MTSKLKIVDKKQGQLRRLAHQYDGMVRLNGGEWKSAVAFDYNAFGSVYSFADGREFRLIEKVMRFGMAWATMAKGGTFIRTHRSRQIARANVLPGGKVIRIEWKEAK